MLLPEIKKYFADENTQNEFEQWQAKQNKDIVTDKK